MVCDVGPKDSHYAEFKLPIHQCDTHGFHSQSNQLHTAVLGTLITNCSLLVCHANDPLERFAVSTDIGFTCLNAGYEGDDLLVKVKLLRLGQTLATANCDIECEKTKTHIASGRHTAMFVGRPGSALNTHKPMGSDFV
jgi:acyl-coenzyme A thioesterase PaaI-like protein